MLQKSAKPRSGFLKFVVKSAKILFVIETVSFAATYICWYRLNTDRDFRQYMNANFPIVLEGYYSFGEFMRRDSRIRAIDKAYWDNNEPSRSQ